MTARFHSSGLPPSRITQGQSPPTRRGAGPSFLESRSSLPPQSSQTVDAERPRCARRSRGPHRQEFEAGLKGTSRNRHERFPMQPFRAITPPKESHPMNATEIASALSARAEDVCRRYLPRGRKQGRYWTIGDTSGAKGRSLFVRLAPPGIPGKWTDARNQRAWRSARYHPSAHRWSIAAARHGGGPRVPIIAAVHSRKWRQSRRRL